MKRRIFLFPLVNMLLKSEKKINGISSNLTTKHNIEKKLDLVRLFNPDKVYKRMLIPKHFSIAVK